MSEHHHGSEKHSHEQHAYSLGQELTCHLPYATFSVAFAIIVLSLVNFVTVGFSVDERAIKAGYHILFHAFHYMHILFATVGTFVAFSRFSHNRLHAVIVSILSPALFCTLSDIALPALAMQLLGISMHVHICFFSLPDFMNVMPFMLVGLVTGYAIARHYSAALKMVSLQSHFVHILISSLAATFYTVSYGFHEWNSLMGLIFLLLVVAVVLPCTISDVVVPMYFSSARKK